MIDNNVDPEMLETMEMLEKDIGEFLNIVNLFSTVIFVSAFVLLVLHVFTSIGLYKISKKTPGVKDSYLSFIPIFNIFILASNVDSYKGRKYLNKMISIILLVLSAFSFIFLIVTLLYMFFLLYFIYKYNTKKYIICLVISILSVGLLVPFILFSIRNNTLILKSKLLNNTEKVSIDMLSLSKIGKLTSLDNGWFLIEDLKHGYIYFIKTEVLDGLAISVLIDNYSLTPVGVYRYNTKNIETSEDWADIYKEPIITSGEYDITILKDYFSPETINQTKMLIKEFL